MRRRESLTAARRPRAHHGILDVRISTVFAGGRCVRQIQLAVTVSDPPDRRAPRLFLFLARIMFGVVFKWSRIPRNIRVHQVTYACDGLTNSPKYLE